MHHVCGVRICINTDHMELVEQSAHSRLHNPKREQAPKLDRRKAPLSDQHRAKISSALRQVRAERRQARGGDRERMRYVAKNLRNVAPDIRDAVVGDAVQHGITISDVVGGILATAWDIPYELSGERTAGLKDADGQRSQLNVLIPQEMAQRIWLVSRSRGLTESSLVQSVLAEHYELDYEPVRRGGATRRRASA